MKNISIKIMNYFKKEKEQEKIKMEIGIGKSKEFIKAINRRQKLAIKNSNYFSHNKIK